MLQMFHLNVSKVNLGVAHVAMAIHACFKCFIYFRRMFQIFHLDVSKVDPVLLMLLWLYTHVSSVSSVSDVCCKHFFWMFQNRSWCCTCCKWLYMHVSIACFKCFICLRRMLQMFYLDVSKVDRALHMLQ